MLSVFVSLGGIPVEAEHDDSLLPLVTVLGLTNVAGLAALGFGMVRSFPIDSLVRLTFLESLAFVATACWPWLELVLGTAL